MKLLVFAGSTRQNSFNRQLAIAAAAIANDAGAEVTHLELATLDLPLHNALLKNAIDWASSPVKGDPEWNRGTEAFEGKVVGLLSTSPGPLGGLRSLSHLNPLLLNLQCWVAPRQFALGSALQAFDANGLLQSEVHRQGVQSVVDQVLWASARLYDKNGL